MGHNHIKDTVAKIMKKVCFDVQTEPHLIPVEPGDLTLAHSNKEPNARLDVSGKGIWAPFDRSFVDIRGSTTTDRDKLTANKPVANNTDWLRKAILNIFLLSPEPSCPNPHFVTKSLRRKQ